jgi:hypothetical protein
MRPQLWTRARLVWSRRGPPSQSPGAGPGGGRAGPGGAVLAAGGPGCPGRGRDVLQMGRHRQVDRVRPGRRLRFQMVTCAAACPPGRPGRVCAGRPCPCHHFWFCLLAVRVRAGRPGRQAAGLRACQADPATWSPAPSTSTSAPAAGTSLAAGPRPHRDQPRLGEWPRAERDPMARERHPDRTVNAAARADRCSPLRPALTPVRRYPPRLQALRLSRAQSTLAAPPRSRKKSSPVTSTLLWLPGARRSRSRAPPRPDTRAGERTTWSSELCCPGPRFSQRCGSRQAGRREWTCSESLAGFGDLLWKDLGRGYKRRRDLAVFWRRRARPRRRGSWL